MPPSAPTFPAVPSAPRSTSTAHQRAQSVADSWPPADVASAAFHLRALGASERDARAIFNALAWRGVRRLSAYVDRMNADDVADWQRAQQRLDAGAVAASAAGALLMSSRSIVQPRQPRRWPWRDNSNQERGDRHA